MGAKKKGKKKDNPEDGGPMDDASKAKMYMATCQALQIQLAQRTEESSAVLAEKRELQRRVEHIQRDFEEERDRTNEIKRDMTRQYKGMQEELLSRINQLEETIQDLRDQLEESQVENERMVSEKDLVIQMRDQQIEQLKNKMQDMAAEFEEMLQHTLDKMRDRIDVSSNNFDMPIQSKMEEFHAASAAAK